MSNGPKRRVGLSLVLGVVLLWLSMECMGIPLRVIHPWFAAVPPLFPIGSEISDSWRFGWVSTTA